MKLFISVKHNNILLFILTYWRQVSVIRPSLQEILKISHM